MRNMPNPQVSTEETMKIPQAQSTSVMAIAPSAVSSDACRGDSRRSQSRCTMAASQIAKTIASR